MNEDKAQVEIKQLTELQNVSEKISDLLSYGKFELIIPLEKQRLDILKSDVLAALVISVAKTLPSVSFHNKKLSMVPKSVVGFSNIDFDLSLSHLNLEAEK